MLRKRGKGSVGGGEGNMAKTTPDAGGKSVSEWMDKSLNLEFWMTS